MIKIIRNTVISMRPEQWTKNLIVFAGLFFGGGFSSTYNVFVCVQVFCIFCLISSGSYIINDIVDRKEDRHHPEKSKRPIASGKLKARAAIIFSLLLIGIGMGWAYALYLKLFVLVALFLIIHLLYDLFLKHVSIVDVFIIAFAFLIRLYGGVMMSPIESRLSSWILLCTLLLALFLALCKRRAEMSMLQDGSKNHRRTLADYNVQFLDQLITIMGSSTVLCYSLYAVSTDQAVHHGSHRLIFTVPLVVYGIFRYLYLVHMKMGGTNPEKLLLRDIPLLTDIILYCLMVYAILYIQSCGMVSTNIVRSILR